MPIRGGALRIIGHLGRSFTRPFAAIFAATAPNYIIVILESQGPSTCAMPSDSNDTLSSSALEPAMRKLPAVPVQSRRASRPLPKIPRALICKKCGTYISSYNVLLPLSSIPPGSRAFRGFSGKASLFTETYNVTLAKPGVQLMATGAHTMQEITCGTCCEYLGWKIIRAHEKSESWKDGNSLLELENLNTQPDPLVPDPTPRRRSSDSGSDYSS